MFQMFQSNTNNELYYNDLIDLPLWLDKFDYISVTTQHSIHVISKYKVDNYFHYTDNVISHNRIINYTHIDLIRKLIYNLYEQSKI